MRRCGVRMRRRRRCSRMKRVQGHSGFTFRCHDAINVRKREREREIIRKAPNIFNIKR